MHTLPHTNPEDGYALRIGKKLPKHAANLAYIHTDTPAPSKNVLVQDLTDSIPENKGNRTSKQAKEATVNKEGFLEDAQGKILLSRPEVLVTNEYSLDSQKEPFYFVYRSRSLFDIRRATVAYPSTSGFSGDEMLFEETDEKSRNSFLYLGEKIQVTQANGGLLAQKDKVKVTLERFGDDPFFYQIVLYTNFTNKETSYELHFPTTEDEQTVFKKEIINPTPIFKEYTSQFNQSIEKSYRVVQEKSGKYSIQLNQVDLTDDFLITVDNRAPHAFQYQILSTISTRFSDKNTAKVRIGFIYINDTVINAVRTTTVLKQLVHENEYMPEYLTFENPHRSAGYHEKSDSMYWEADLNMPKEHWLDYDVLILSGYGDKDFSTVSESMRTYLDAGGILLMDTSGTGSQVLNPINQKGKQTFLVDISFSKTNNESTYKDFTKKGEMKDRYYDIKHPERIGRISPIISFHNQENINDWDVFLTYQNGGPALMRRNVGFNGQLVVSNMGWMLDILYGKEESIQFFSNFLLFLLEKRNFVTPVFNQFVYHKDNLYPIEYQGSLGETLYAEDRSDEDGSQIVAKKILHNRTEDFARNYLPESYRTWQTAEFESKVSDEGLVNIENPSFELTNASGETSWQKPTLDALPGYDFVKFSGDSVLGEQNTSLYKEGKRSLYVKTINSQGFFEQNLGVLSQGLYELDVFVRADSSEGGGVALYQTDGTLFKASKEIIGKSNWQKVTIHFEINEPSELNLRLGAHSKAQSTSLYFDDLRLKTTGVVRMTPKNNGGSPLYAYAITPKAKNSQLNNYEQTNTKSLFTQKDAEETFVLTIKSFVYQWFSQEVRYKKKYGNEKQSTIQLKTNDKEKVLGNIQQFLPPLKSGAEWARKDRVYYELTIQPHDKEDFLNLSMYDPSTDKYFFNPYGEWILNHEDIWWNGYDSTVQVRAELLNYNILATGSQFMLKEKEETQLRVFPPATEDERDRWYLRVQNGSFQKVNLQSKDKEDIRESGRPDYYEEFIHGVHNYQLPEYQRQSFYPVYGERLIEQEKAVYVNDYSIEVQRGPLLIKEKKVIKERLKPLNEEQTAWQSQQIMWDKDILPEIYWDEWDNGSLSLLTEGFEIDYKEGKVFFNKAITGTIFASYNHDNFHIIRRKYANTQIKAELLRSRDNHTFDLGHENLATYPAPVFYQGTVSEKSRIHPASYWVDYEAGSVTFFQETRQRIYADYLYYIEEELNWEDANQHSGEIELKERISFKDEIFVSYLAEENAVEYKGYFDETLNTFVHLDLNPTAGHTFTLSDEIDGQKRTREVQGEKLLNKEVYVYILPYTSTYYKTTETNNHTLRHTFGEDNWKKVKAVHPEALLISIVQVRENTDIDQVVVMDARRRGGGLKEEISQEQMEKRVGYTSAFWDIGDFDGLAYYKNGVTVVQLPETVLKENGGHFTEGQIRKTLDKYLAFGVYPIVEFKKETIKIEEEPDEE